MGKAPNPLNREWSLLSLCLRLPLWTPRLTLRLGALARLVETNLVAALLALPLARLGPLRPSPLSLSLPWVAMKKVGGMLWVITLDHGPLARAAGGRAGISRIQTSLNALCAL